MRRVFIDRSELKAGGYPIIESDEHGRIKRHRELRIPKDAVLRFDINGVPGPDRVATLWIEWEDQSAL